MEPEANSEEPLRLSDSISLSREATLYYGFLKWTLFFVGAVVSVYYIAKAVVTNSLTVFKCGTDYYQWMCSANFSSFGTPCKEAGQVGFDMGGILAWIYLVLSILSLVCASSIGITLLRSDAISHQLKIVGCVAGSDILFTTPLLVTSLLTLMGRDISTSLCNTVLPWFQHFGALCSSTWNFVIILNVIFLVCGPARYFKWLRRGWLYRLWSTVVAVITGINMLGVYFVTRGTPCSSFRVWWVASSAPYFKISYYMLFYATLGFFALGVMLCQLYKWVQVF